MEVLVLKTPRPILSIGLDYKEKLGIPAMVWTMILLIALFCFQPNAAQAEEPTSFPEAGEKPTASDKIHLEVNSAVWPCFPIHFFDENASLSDVFVFPDDLYVEISDNAEFLSDSVWSSACLTMYEKERLLTTVIEVNVGKVGSYEPTLARLRLADFIAFHVAFEIWQRLATELEASERYIESFISVSSAVEQTYTFMSLCALNIDLRERFASICNYSEFRALMTSALANYNRFIEAHGTHIRSEGMRASLHETTSRAYEQSMLIQDWE